MHFRPAKRHHCENLDIIYMHSWSYIEVIFPNSQGLYPITRILTLPRQNLKTDIHQNHKQNAKSKGINTYILYTTHLMYVHRSKLLYRIEPEIQIKPKDLQKSSQCTHFSIAVMMMGGMTRMGAGRTNLVMAVWVTAWRGSEHISAYKGRDVPTLVGSGWY